MLRALGCLFLLILLAAGGYFTRGIWLPLIDRDRAASDRGPTWQALTPDGAQRARAALQRLQSPRGAVYVTVAPGDLAAYIVQELSRTLPASADTIEAAAIGDRLYVRTSIRTSDLGDKASLGPFAMLLGERERIQLGGVVRVIRPGFGELQVKEFRIRDFSIPQALIPRLIRQLTPGHRPADLSPDGLPLRLPDYIGDVRVSGGQITLYKTPPALTGQRQVPR